MGNVAHAAPFDFLGQMLVDPGASFLRVAIETDLVLNRGVRLSQTGPVAGPVRGMAVDTSKRPLQDPMVV